MKNELINSVSGVIPFLIHFIPAIALVMLFMWIYMKLTPYDEVSLIKENNNAAAITYFGALLGFAFPLTSALANSVGVIDFLIWAIFAGIAQLVTFLAFRQFYPRIAERVTAGETAAAIKLAGWSVMVGLVNAAAITY